MISPIAGLTILTVFAAQTTLVNHIRTGIVSTIKRSKYLSNSFSMDVIEACVSVVGVTINFMMKSYVLIVGASYNRSHS